MTTIKQMPLVLAASLLLLLAPLAQAQEKSKDKKEFKVKNDKAKVDKQKDKVKYKGNYKNKNSNENYKSRDNQLTGGTLGDILGRVILPPTGTRAPRRLEGVPPGHYPPPGKCRIWYPNRPPGHQPSPTDCHNLVGVRLDPGAFILHGDQAYDAEYDWREEERRRPGSVGRDILDILFPRR